MVSILSWNLDGLDDEELEARTEAVIGIVLQGNYDVVFFQELVPSTFIKYCEGLSEKYKVISGFAGCVYFIATLLRKAPSIRYLDHYIHPFPNTTMGRNLLVTKVSIVNLKLALLNTHLESMLPSSEERKTQLKTCFQIALNFPPDFNVFFGGDMNLRDWEATADSENMRISGFKMGVG
ncbi:Tyrosyl-DNA phosphodiesterase 2 [Orchesella cincta]|uniref:Tyrosyl-DNA phosphodiesterase 2 n=1 Tax=Orchesella cincta TaxID=48709 RepID=A0A1D2M461_ORCCI|nr:Tyrosyl-DNA phosphodiesterase 2 [Orchesella cincta]